MKIARILLNLWRYGRSPASALKAFRAIRDYRYVLHSEFFDRAWVERQYVGMRENAADPVFACLVDGFDPSRDFSSQEYLALHGLESKGVNALVHYERVGKHKGYAISYLDQKAHGGKVQGIYDHQKVDANLIASIHKAAIERIREKRKRNVPVRVVFVVFNASMFPARPLLDAMLLDGSYEPRVAVIPNLRVPENPQKDMKRCKEELLKDYSADLFLEIEGGAGYVDCLAGADVICYSTPYDYSYFKYGVRWSLYCEALSIYFNYSYIVARFSIEVFKQANFVCFWKVFFEHKETLDTYRDVALSGGSNGVLVGYLKMDAFRRHEEKSNEQTARKMIVIAPHHSFKGGYNDYLQISNFLEYAEYFQKLPARFPQIDFVFRPHPYFRSALIKDSVWGEARTNEYFKRLLSNSNVSLSVENNYLDLFARSDGLIQDCGSFLAEYFYTGKPQCYLLRSHDDACRAFTHFGLTCLEHCYQAFSTEDVDRYIKDVVLASNDSMRGAREVFQREVMYNYPSVASRVLQVMSAAMYDNNSTVSPCAKMELVLPAEDSRMW